mmetsp:Transcript_67002/g.216591  ORF Transcript_67002/g.216591 Transcript_67002/m.216591 type:complete len:231 (+) Transcript_67002:893-1585(+)
MYLRYSVMVEAPMIWMSPRDIAGFKMLAASMAPPSPPPPAPTRVWISSIMMMTSPDSFISLMMFFKRSSNSPLYFEPDNSMPMSNWMMRLFLNISGTSPSTMRLARPSAMAVLPTPGSPMKTGLFFWRRARIWMARSISSSLPTNGSKAPSAHALVRSLPNSASADVGLDIAALPPRDASTGSSSSVFSMAESSRKPFASSSGICATSTFISSKTLTTFKSCTFKIAKRI